MAASSTRRSGSGRRRRDRGASRDQRYRAGRAYTRRLRRSSARTTTPSTPAPGPPPAEQQPPPPPASSSSTQTSEQPSPLNVLPSSQSSPRSTYASPHRPTFAIPTMQTSSRFQPPS